MTDSPLLEVRELTVSYGGVVAVDDVSFAMFAGQLVGLIGPNGAGKTTCIDALTGFTMPTRGKVHFDGQPLDSVSPHQRARRGFTRTFQSLELFEDLTVRENVFVSASTPTWLDTVTDALWPKRMRGSDLDDVLELAGLGSVADSVPSELSNGQRHLAAVARGLASRPKLLLLDEPAAGLDPSETAALGELLKTLSADGLGILLVDHDMPLVLGVCEHVHVLDLGRLIASGTPAEVRADREVISAYLGEPVGGATDG